MNEIQKIYATAIREACAVVNTNPLIAPLITDRTAAEILNGESTQKYCMGIKKAIRSAACNVTYRLAIKKWPAITHAVFADAIGLEKHNFVQALYAKEVNRIKTQYGLDVDEIFKTVSDAQNQTAQTIPAR